MAKRKFEEDAKMSRRDIRDEMKQDQGDPLIKRRQRQLMRELMALGGNVAEATVLVTNPTHLAVAIRYDPTKDAAPMVLAKAKDEAALNMRREARKHGVPIVENKPFARAMYKDAKVGEVLPADLFGPAAAIIAHVLGLGRSTAGASQ
jgi:flagellar biosynthetic protein FlhB